MPDSNRGLPRREFVKAALAIGGSSALAACMDRAGADDEDDFDVPQGVDDPSVLPDRQHAWNDYEVRDPNGNTVVPQHQTLLFFDYVGDGPTAEEREQVESALRTIERAFQWGIWDQDSAVVHQGILFMLGYSTSFFDDVYGERPAGVDLWPGSKVIDRLGEDAEADDYDAAMVLNADFPRIILGIEEALKGNRETLNGVPVEGDFTGVLETVERRTAFIGKGLPADKLDQEDIHEDAPLAMGFKSGFNDNQAPEDKVTIQDGPFAGGTVLGESRLFEHLDRWYDKDEEGRVECMFSPDHDIENVGETGQRLGSNSELTKETVEDLPEDARAKGCIGHSQKVARARDEDFVPRILRRSEGNSTQTDEPSFNFGSIQRRTIDFVEAREAMSNEDFEDEVDAEDSGIVDFLETARRGFFLVPSRSNRALPDPGA